ncbi:ACP S-malonyltransferase [Parasphingopyxis marina]|uniref:Malonyl CoA-acyl carrier protein transacylase n=1 Tax=Parasphingopyxis marina TaxID=2761622 RepID=A0A842HZ93_9SPHN|nr:ACP S-malonyltransferase [Parasphingopyxis marina]MBC2778175.1 ACP S-malonyltransferase [Parasphingopyxis marina]
MRAFIFPGQGSQVVGMGRDLADASAAAREVFEEVDEALGQNLSKLMREGPEDELTLTENAQPAIMANAIAVLRVLEKEAGIALAGTADFVAGHSLGEYTALCAAGGFDLATTAKLLKRRGQAMQAAVPVGEGAMAVFLGLDFDAAEAVVEEAAEGDVCVIANDNAPGQIVISGHSAAVERACDLGKERGARRAMPLAVSAPFHCPLMKPAADAMNEALETVEIHPLAAMLYANVTASPVGEHEAIRGLLVEQVTAMVRWRESIEEMAKQGVTHFIEFGGKVVAPMVKRIAPEADQTSVVSMDDVEALAKIL